MKKQKRNASLDEALRKKWAIRIMLEKEYTKSAAQWMTDRLENLIDYMLWICSHSILQARRNIQVCKSNSTTL